MWTAETRTLVGDFGAGQALSDEQYALLVPMIPPAKPGGRPRTTGMRRPLDGLLYLVRPGRHARHRQAGSAGRPVVPGAHRPPVAPPAAAPGLPALADGPRLHARLRERGRLGGDPPPPRGDAARTRRRGAQPHRRDRRHPGREDDGKGGPRGDDAAKKVWGRKRHLAVDTGGLLLGVVVHAADVQDADGVGDLL